MKVDEPFLDGMPEVPPAWVRPEQGVRLPAVWLERMLAAALAHVGNDDELPLLQTIRLDVTDGLLTSRATDRYSAIRERRPVSQTCDDFDFLLRSQDAASLRVLLKAVLRGMKDEEKDAEPVDLALEVTDDGPTLRILGQDLDVRFTQHEVHDPFPTIDGFVDRALDAVAAGKTRRFDSYINPTLLARIVPAQRAGRSTGLFRFQRPKDKGPVVVTTLDEDDDLVIALMPLNAPDGDS